MIELASDASCTEDTVTSTVERNKEIMNKMLKASDNGKLLTWFDNYENLPSRAALKRK